MIGKYTLNKVISGGQTGVDRAALDAAITYGISHGGYCPKGRLAEDGPISKNYNLIESRTDKYPERTRLNVHTADATLVIMSSISTGRGTGLTLKILEDLKKPYHLVYVEKLPPEVAAAAVAQWLKCQRPTILNVAGPRESSQPGVYQYAHKLLIAAFALLDSYL